MFNTLKKLSLALIVASTAFFQISCKNTDADPDKLGNWYKTSIPSFGGSARASAVSFAIGDKGYIGTGITNETIQRVKDFWSYDTKTKIWSQIAEFGGTGRNNAVAFVVGGKAYVGTGFDGNTVLDNGYKKDFWQYDPSTNKWKAVADFLGGTRMYSSAFVVGDKAYVGLGWNGSGYYQDFYSYDAVNNKWAEVATFVGGKRRGASAFTIGGKAYVGFGTNNSTLKTKDIYQFDPSGNSGMGSWTRIEFTEDNLAVRAGALSLVIGEKAYIIGGEGQSDVWEFNPTASTMWTQLNPFGVARGYAGGFAVGSTIYLGTGSSGSSYSDDFWAFDPTAVLNEDDDL
jgi:N-acetylneuraminic acid mutarotase